MLVEVALFVGLVGAGYLVRVFLEHVLGLCELCERIASALTWVVYYVLIPVAFTATFARRGLLVLDAYVLVYYALLVLLVHFITGRLYQGSERLVAFVLSAFPNSVFLGFPVCYVLFGNIDVASVFGTLTVALNVTIPGVLVGGRGLGEAMLSLLSSTAFIGFATGTVLYYVLGPGSRLVYDNLWWSTLALSYTATFTMGLRIPPRLHGFRRHANLLATVGLARFVISPLLPIPISLLAGFTRESLLQLAVVSATPPAVLNVLIAQKYGLNSQVAAVLTAVLTAVFLVIVFPVLALVVKTLL